MKYPAITVTLTLALCAAAGMNGMVNVSGSKASGHDKHKH